MRLISATDQLLPTLTGAALSQAIAASEGRVIASEVIAPAPPLLDNTSNVELAAAFGADLLILNLYDTRNPQIMGLPDVEGVPSAAFGYLGLGRGRNLRDVAQATGRVVGVNLEPFPVVTEAVAGRAATAENAQVAITQGAQFLVITGNPATGVTLAGIAAAVREIKDALGEIFIVAGKMHAAGVTETFGPADIERLVTAGADCLLLPTPGTVPGVTIEQGRDWVTAAHQAGALVLNAIGTSQEGASVAVIEQFALASKMTGADIHHLGDSGFFGMTVPENLLAFSLAIRGRRHTWHRMAVRHR